jgi:alpha-galactosidase
VHLAHERVSVVIDVSGGVPEIVHWGAVLASPSGETLATMIGRPLTYGSLDVVPPLQIVPQHSLGSLARPGVVGHRPGGRDWAPRFVVAEIDATPHRRVARQCNDHQRGRLALFARCTLGVATGAIAGS